MILIISENDQIIGSDEEFLNGQTLENLKESFPSLSLFALQAEESDVFDFEYNEKQYYVNKHKIIIESQNAYLYLFAKTDEKNIDSSLNEKAILPSINEIKEEKITESEPKQEPASAELDLDLGTPSEEPKEEVSLELGLDTEPKQEPASAELDLDLGTPSEEPKEEEEDIPIKISKEEIEHDLEQASQDLGIPKDMLMEFFNDFKQQLLDEKEIFLTAIKNNDYETLHKSAHKLKGVALNLRLAKCGDLLRTTDDFSKQKEDIKKISKLLNTIYASLTDRPILDSLDSIKTTEKNNILELDKEMSDKDKKVLFKTLIDFLESVKGLDVNTLKAQLKAAYALVPIKSLKEIDTIADDKTKEFVNELQKSLKKEIE